MPRSTFSKGRKTAPTLAAIRLTKATPSSPVWAYFVYFVPIPGSFCGSYQVDGVGSIRSAGCRPERVRPRSPAIHGKQDKKERQERPTGCADHIDPRSGGIGAPRMPGPAVFHQERVNRGLRRSLAGHLVILPTCFSPPDREKTGFPTPWSRSRYRVYAVPDPSVSIQVPRVRGLRPLGLDPGTASTRSPTPPSRSRYRVHAVPDPSHGIQVPRGRGPRPLARDPSPAWTRSRAPRTGSKSPVNAVPGPSHGIQVPRTRGPRPLARDPSPE